MGGGESLNPNTANFNPKADGSNAGGVGYTAPGTKPQPGVLLLGSGQIGDTKVGTAADLAAFASSSTALQLMGSQKPRGPGGASGVDPSSALAGLQKMGVYEGKTTDSSDPIIKAYQDWLVANAKGNANQAQIGQMIANEPGQKQTILTPQNSKTSILGGL